MADTAALVVALSAQLTKFEKDMQSAVGIADRGVKRIEKSFNDINPRFSGINKALAGAITTTAIIAAARGVQQLVEQVDNLGDQAEIVGLTTDQFQELRFAIIATGQSAEAANAFMERFARQLSEAQKGSGALFEIFKANQIDPRGIKDVNQGLQIFADLVAGATKDSDKLNMAMAVGGRQAGPSLVQALKQGSAGLAAMGAEARRLGVVLDKDVIKKGQDIQTAYAIVAAQITTLFQQMAIVIGGIIVDLVARLKNIKLPSVSGGPQSIPEFFRGKNSLTTFFGKGPFGNQPRGDEGETKVTVPGNLPETKMAAEGADKAIQNLLKSQQRHIELMKAEADALGKTAGEQERLRVEAQLTAAILANDQSPAAYATQIAQIGDAVQKAADDLARRQFQFNEIASASRELGSALSEAFQGAIIEGKKFDEVLNNLVRRLESRAFDKLFDLAFAPQGAATSSVFTQLIQSLTGKAAGGPVRGGQPYLVGEKGPELFVPGQSGMIVPNKPTSKGGQVGDRNLNVSVDVTGANGDQAIEDAVNRGVQRAVQQSVSIVNTTAPGRQLRYSQLGT